MDTHILTAPGTLASGSEAAPEACLPGEGAPPLAAGPDERSRASVPSRRRRGALLTTSCIVVAALAAGGVFLISPYNHIVPIHTARLPSAARQVAASGGFSPEVPLAPAATLATAPLPATGPPPVRKPVVAESKETQIPGVPVVPHVRSGAAGSARRNRFRQRRPHRCRLPRRTPGAPPALCLRCTRSGFRHLRLRRHQRFRRATIRSARVARKQLQWLPLRPRARSRRHRQVPSQRGFRGASRLVRRHLLWRTRLSRPSRMRCRRHWLRLRPSLTLWQWPRNSGRGR